MCRFAAYLGADAAASVLVFEGDHSLVRQSWAPRELLEGSVNADGYGVVWYSDGRPVRIAEARPIWYDEELEQTLGAIRSTAIVAALRNGTPGLPVGRSALLPMTQQGWSFVLNGYVPDFRAQHMRTLRSALTDDLYGLLTGVSDSETLFLLAIGHLRSGATLREALERTAATVRQRVRTGEAQLAMTITDGTSLAAIRTSTVTRTNSLYWSRDVATLPSGVVLASEPLSEEATWAPVEEHGWIEIDLDGTVRRGLLEER